MLSRADLIAAEDTRHSKKLLTHFGIAGELTPYHEHNAERERPRLMARLSAGPGHRIDLDAGTPLVSDPGYKFVREALDQGIVVTSIPGPSAVRRPDRRGAADRHLPVRGLPAAEIGPRRCRLEELKDVPATLILFETGPRLVKSPTDMAAVLARAKQQSPRSHHQAA